MADDSTPSTSHRLHQIAELTGHEDRVWCVAWNPVRPLIASCSADKTVRISHYQQKSSDLNESNEESSSLEIRTQASIPTGHTKTVRCVTWAPTGETFAAASFDANISVWEQERRTDGDGDFSMAEDGGQSGGGEWECASLLEGHETECKCVAYSCLGNLLASCSRDKTVWVWEVQPDSDFECMGVLMNHTQDVKCVAWHPTEEILASGSYDDTIKLYVDDPDDDWYDFQTLTAHTSTVWSLAFSPCGELLASASDDKTIRIWRREEKWRWVEKAVIKGHDRSIYSISWRKTPGAEGEGVVGDDRGWLASASGDGRINIWDIRLKDNIVTTELVARVENAHGVCDVNCISWCPRPGFEDYLATAGDDYAVRVWKISKT